MYRVEDDLKEFVESGPAVMIGTGDGDRRPHVMFGWSPRVGADRTSIEVFLDAARADTTLRNLQANGRIAMTIADPVSYRSVQFKGRFRGSEPPTKSDLAWVRRGREAFLAVTSLIGDAPGMIRSLWLDAVVRIDFDIENAYDQTPGPGAGKPL